MWHPVVCFAVPASSPVVCAGPQVFAWPSRKAPRAFTEGQWSASVIGCTYYVVVAIIWTIIWCDYRQMPSCLPSVMASSVHCPVAW